MLLYTQSGGRESILCINKSVPLEWDLNMKILTDDQSTGDSIHSELYIKPGTRDLWTSWKKEEKTGLKSFLQMLSYHHESVL